MTDLCPAILLSRAFKTMNSNKLEFPPASHVGRRKSLVPRTAREKTFLLERNLQCVTLLQRQKLGDGQAHTSTGNCILRTPRALLNHQLQNTEKMDWAEQRVSVPLPSVTAVLKKSPFPVSGTLPRRWAEGWRLAGPQGRACSHPCCLISRGSDQRRKGWQGEVLLLRSQSSSLTLFLVLWKTLDQVSLAPAHLCPWRTG